MDGTLVDTERLWWEAVEQVADGLGRRLTGADQPEVLGRPVEYTAAWLGGITGAGVGRSPPSCTGSSRTGFAPASCPARVRCGSSANWSARVSPPPS